MAAPTCSVCSREDADQINAALVAGESYSRIIERHKPLTAMSVSRHKNNHLTPDLVAYTGTTGREGTTAERVETLYLRAEKVLSAAEASKQGPLALSSIRELRAIVELIARLSGDLDDRPTMQVLNVTTSPEWTDVRHRILSALAPFPQARIAVAQALDGEPQRALT